MSFLDIITTTTNNQPTFSTGFDPKEGRFARHHPGTEGEPLGRPWYSCYLHGFHRLQCQHQLVLRRQVMWHSLPFPYVNNLQIQKYALVN